LVGEYRLDERGRCESGVTVEWTGEKYESTGA